MRFMLMQYYQEIEGVPPMTEWAPGDIKAHIEFQQDLNDELTRQGELVDAQGLAGPELARFVVADGASAPVITDGPYPEYKELLAGYRVVDVETADRAIEIAAQTSAAAMAHGPDVGLELLAGLDDRLGGHHRLHAVRAHLLERAGQRDAAIAEYRIAAARTTNLPEHRYLTTRAARLAVEADDDRP